MQVKRGSEESWGNGQTAEVRDAKKQKSSWGSSRETTDVPSKQEISRASKSSPKRTHVVPKNTWLFSENSFIFRSPSRIQLKMTAPQELKVRESIHDFIIKLASKLKLDGRTILAATIYVNRFYMRMPITSSKYYVASAAIAISSKLNDNYRQPDKIALQACNLKNPVPAKPIDEQSDMFWRWRDQLLFREELILKTLNFDLNIDLPYEIRDELLDELDSSPPQASLFEEKKADILKNTISLLEITSSLPILVSFDTRTLFGTLMIVIVWEGRTKLKDDSLKLPENYLASKLNIDSELCFQCYKYILKLLKLCEEDAKVISNKVAAKRLVPIEEPLFKEIANCP